MLAKDIMTAEVVTVREDATVEEIVKILFEKNIGGVPVVNDKNEVVGIVTEGDLIFRSKKLQIPPYFSMLGGFVFLQGSKAIEEQVKKMVGYKAEEIMTKKVVTVDEDTDLEEISTIMVNKNINRVPVVVKGKLVGIISRKDIIKAYTIK